MVFDTERGLVILSGCGHAGDHQHRRVRPRSIARPRRCMRSSAGCTCSTLDDETLAWTASKLKAHGLENLVGAHCTGLEAVYRIREQAGLARRACVVGAVGSVFDLEKGIDPRDLAR